MPADGEAQIQVGVTGLCGSDRKSDTALRVWRSFSLSHLLVSSRQCHKRDPHSWSGWID